MKTEMTTEEMERIAREVAESTDAHLFRKRPETKSAYCAEIMQAVATWADSKGLQRVSSSDGEAMLVRIAGDYEILVRPFSDPQIQPIKLDWELVEAAAGNIVFP